MGVLQACRSTDLPLEPLWAERHCQFRMEHLQCDWSVVLEIVCQVHGGHAAPAQLALEPVTAN